MHHIPARVQHPSGANHFVRGKSLVRAVGHNCSKQKFPFAQPAVQVRSTGTGEHDCHEISSIRLSKKGNCGDKQQSHDNWRGDLRKSDCDGHPGVVPGDARETQHYAHPGNLGQVLTNDVIVQVLLKGVLSISSWGTSSLARSNDKSLILVSNGKDPIEGQRQHRPQCNPRDVQPHNR